MAQVFTAPITVNAFLASGKSTTFKWKVIYGDVWWFNAHPMTFIQDSFPQALQIESVRFEAEGPPHNRLFAHIKVTNANNANGCKFGLWVAATSG